MDDKSFNEQSLFDNQAPMKRLSFKGKLIKDTLYLFQGISKYSQVLTGRNGKKLRKKAERSLYKDFCAGLRNIDCKIPVYIELPKLEKYGNGSYVEKLSNGEKNNPEEVKIENAEVRFLEE